MEYVFTPEQKDAARKDPVMTDIETLGVRPTSAMISIGACKFDPETNSITDVFHKVIKVDRDNLPTGLTFDQSTIEFWEKQSDEAKAGSYSNPDGEPLRLVLASFAEFIHPTAQLWGNGSDFDNVIIAHSYGVTEMTLPWKFWNNRCYRTMKNMYPEVGFTRHGVHHNALDDAISQAKHLMKILDRMRAQKAALG